VRDPANRKPIEVLLVEDNPGEIRLVCETFQESDVSCHLSVVRDGAEALTFLRREANYAQAPCPDLILLDLNLPKQSGREVLAVIKSHPMWKRIPVVVLTNSEADDDVLGSYELHANCYITKGSDLNEFITVAKIIRDFWFSIVRLPPR
jgi:two-component system, chemotaxis family, response regulator Rcp1